MISKCKDFIDQYWPAIAVGLIALVMIREFIYQDGLLGNTGFLVLGAAIAMLSGIINDRIDRRQRAKDLARALYVELADRIARCCYDYEQPWRQYGTLGGYPPGAMDSFRLRKFSPVTPLIYTAAAGQLALLKGDAPQSLVQFYYRLEAWRRDVENIAAASQGSTGGVTTKSIQFLALRLKQTLGPGLTALTALAPHVSQHLEIEKTAIAPYDETRPGPAAKGSLRSRIESLL